MGSQESHDENEISVQFFQKKDKLTTNFLPFSISTFKWKIYKLESILMLHLN